MEGEYKTRIQSLIDDAVEASQIPAKRRATDIKPKVAELTSVAYNQGLLPEELLQLVDLVLSRSHLDQASLNNIIKSLYPVGNVSQDAVLKIIGALGIGELKPSLNLQSSLLVWIIHVYHVLDLKAQGVLSRAYSVLFNLLDVSATRPQLFHILAIITRRKHVQHYRIQSLLNQTRQNPNDRHLQGLLRVYRNYYPEIIVGNPGKGSTFKLPDAEWRDRLAVIQKMYREQQQSSITGPRDGFKTTQHFGQGPKGAKSLGVPPVQTSNTHEKSVTLEEVDSADTLASNLEKIELPDHIVAVLVDPLLQKFMMLKPETDFKRAASWMDVQMAEILNGDADEDTVASTLNTMREYARNTKDITPFLVGLVRLLERRLHLQPGAPPIFDILAYCPILEPNDLTVLLSTLESTLDRSTTSQLQLLDLYTDLAQHWGARLLNNEIPSHASASIAQLLEQANQLSLTILQTSSTEYTSHKILDFYDRTSFIYSQTSLLRMLQITMPPVPLVYTLQFSPSLATVSRLCTVLTVYKQACAVYMSNAAKKLGPAYDKQQVNTFNGFLMDICNGLWRAKAFAKSDAHSRGCMVADKVIAGLDAYIKSLTDSGSSEMTLGALFTMSYSPLLCLQAKGHIFRLEEKEDEEVELQARHAGPVTQKSLAQLGRKGGLELTWQDFRLGVLRLLEDKEWNGIPELMYSTMKNLLDARSKSS